MVSWAESIAHLVSLRHKTASCFVSVNDLLVISSSLKAKAGFPRQAECIMPYIYPSTWLLGTSSPFVSVLEAEMDLCIVQMYRVGSCLRKPWWVSRPSYALKSRTALALSPLRSLPERQKFRSPASGSFLILKPLRREM